MRAHVAKQNSPLEFAMKSMSDDRVLGALLHAPAFLSGLTDDQLNAIRHRAREAAHPAEAESHRWLKKALEEVRSGVEAAKRAVQERTGAAMHNDAPRLTSDAVVSKAT